MSARLFLSMSPGEIRAALEEKGELAAFRLVRTGAPVRVGEVFLGRVVALRPELPAAFVDIGLGRPAFLDAKDTDLHRGIAGMTEGQELLVEVTKEARADKAVGIRVFRGKGERQAKIEALARDRQPPSRLEAAPPPIVDLLRALIGSRPDRIVIDDRAGFAAARAYLQRRHADLSVGLMLYTETMPLFEHAGLAGAIDELLASRLMLSCGGVVFIETTHAGTIIDVDSGRASALGANIEAARKVAQQIRLRNIGGPVVIDFIGTTKKSEQEEVLATLRSAIDSDPEKPELLGRTRLGHIELVRRRRGAPLAEILFEQATDGSWRKTALTLALEALRAAAREALAQPGRALALAVHPEIAAALASGEGGAARHELEGRLAVPCRVEAQPERTRDSFDVRFG